jgi:hypothetical protein
MLEDYTGYSLKTRHVGNFGFRLIVLGALTILLFIAAWNDNVGYNLPSLQKMNQKLTINIFWASIYTLPLFFVTFLLLISTIFYLMGRRRYLEIRGRYNSVEVLVSSIQSKSLKKFINKIEEQRNNTSLLRGQ